MYVGGMLCKIGGMRGGSSRGAELAQCAVRKEAQVNDIGDLAEAEMLSKVK